MQHLQEDGSYNQLYPKSDSYSKNETLTNNTSQMFRIDNGTPEDVFKWLRKYNQHEWKKVNVSMGSILNLSNLSGRFSSEKGQIYYSKEIVVESDSYIRLKNPLFLDGAVKDVSKQIVEQAPCYIQYFWKDDGGGLTGVSSAIYYIPERATWGESTSDTIYYYHPSNSDYNDTWSLEEGVQYVQGKLENQKGTEWLFSSNESAYPKTYTTEDASLSLILNENQTYSISGLSKITYSDTCSFNNPDIWLGDSTAIDISSRDTNVNAIKNKYVHFTTKYSTSLLAKRVFFIPDKGQDLIANINSSFHFEGQIVDFTRKQQEYYTLEYKGIPFENLKELTV